MKSVFEWKMNILNGGILETDFETENSFAAYFWDKLREDPEKKMLVNLKFFKIVCLLIPWIIDFRLDQRYFQARIYPRGRV